jgi:putative ABC transport system permease protein
MIPVSLRANFSYLLRHPLQLALALLGIGIGVAVIVAVDLANASARKAFLMSMDAVTGEATHQVIGGPRGIDESVYVRLRVDEGIRSIAPIVEGMVSVNETSFTLMGVDLFAEREMRAFTGGARTAPGNDSAGESLFRDREGTFVQCHACRHVRRGGRFGASKPARRGYRNGAGVAG